MDINIKILNSLLGNFCKKKKFIKIINGEKMIFGWKNVMKFRVLKDGCGAKIIMFCNEEN